MRDRVPGDGPKCWCGKEAVFSGHCADHAEDGVLIDDLPAAWTLPEALALVRMLEKELSPVGFHVALVGSVLMEGRSRKDLDLILFPHNTGKVDIVEVWQRLHRVGLREMISRGKVAMAWERQGSIDAKHVEVWMYQNRRVDLFFMR